MSRKERRWIYAILRYDEFRVRHDADADPFRAFTGTRAYENKDCALAEVERLNKLREGDATPTRYAVVPVRLVVDQGED